jgi:ABC-2 type transport system ATP-binding protein
VGVLLDASAQHAGRTGREILTLAQQYMDLPRARVEEMLAVVSLTPDEAGRRPCDDAGRLEEPSGGYGGR